MEISHTSPTLRSASEEKSKWKIDARWLSAFPDLLPIPSGVVITCLPTTSLGSRYSIGVTLCVYNIGGMAQLSLQIMKMNTVNGCIPPLKRRELALEVLKPIEM